MIVRSIWEGGRDIVCIHVPVLVINQNMISFVSSPEEELHCWGGGYYVCILIYGWLFEYKLFFFLQEQGYSLEGEGRQRFTKAVDLIHSYMTKKILGTLKKEDVEFMECPGGQDNAQAIWNVLSLKYFWLLTFERNIQDKLSNKPKVDSI